MKLISCHIENFGKLHDLTMTFDAGVNVVCEENGWGKSTFAAFIRAMFYGLDGERKRSIEENERKRYAPWQGGPFGGQLVFETEERTYQISRIFKDKERNDEFELRDADTNLISRDFSENIGEELFRINRESFLNTVFIRQGYCETFATDDINAKMENLADSTSDLNCFETAAGCLERIKNQLTPNHSKGSISKRKNEIAECERIVRDGQELPESIHQIQELLRSEEETYKTLTEQIRKAGELQTRAAQLQSAAAEKTEWERLKKERSTKKEELRVIRQKFPGEIPDTMEIKERIGECGQMEKAEERAALYKLTDDENTEYAELSVLFQNGIPEEQTITDMIAEESRFRALTQELRSEQLSPAEQKRLEELKPSFENKTESPARIAARWSERSTKKAAEPSRMAALTALNASTGTQQQSGHAGAGKRKLFFAAGILFILLGGAMLVSISTIIGMISAIIGVVSLIYGLMTGKTQNETEPSITEPSSELANLQRTMQEDAAFIRETDEEVRQYLAAHGREFEEYMVSAQLQEIMAEAREYDTLVKRSSNATPEKLTEQQQLCQNISSFLEQYDIQTSETSFADDLHSLKDRAATYRTLHERQKNWKLAVQEYEHYRERVSAFFNKYGLADSCELWESSVNDRRTDTISALSEIRENVIACQNGEHAYQRAKTDLEQFESEHDVSALADAKTTDELAAELPSPEIISEKALELNNHRELAHKNITAYNKQLEDLQERFDEWEENRNHLVELKELQADEQRKFNHIRIAQAKLELAKETMMAKYSEPILNGFSKYYKMLTGEDASSFHVDARTELTIDECGKQRQTNALSTGFRDLAGICLRLALIDAMYQEEAPVLVMDDPFSNLDDAKTAAGIRFLANVAERYQILYFTCSSARK